MGIWGLGWVDESGREMIENMNDYYALLSMCCLNSENMSVCRMFGLILVVVAGPSCLGISLNR